MKQGGMSSPIFVYVYLDELLCKLHAAGIVCRIGNLFTSVLAYVLRFYGPCCALSA